LNNDKSVKVGISARHVHLTQESVEELFGKNYELTKLKDLYQPNEFACNEQVTIFTENGSIQNVRVLGPTREYNQVEVSRSDARKLKINPPVRNSGLLEDSAAISISGPNGTIFLKEGCIIATRHIHLSTEEAQNFDLKNNDVVSVEVKGEKGGIMHNVFCKIKDNLKLELHIDVDDANAFALSNNDFVSVIKP